MDKSRALGLSKPMWRRDNAKFEKMIQTATKRERLFLRIKSFFLNKNGSESIFPKMAFVTTLTIAAIIILLIQGGGLKLSLETYQWLVLVGVVPAVLAVLVLLIFVREVRRVPSGSSSSGRKWNPLY